MYLIYKIISKTTGKSYVGHTYNLSSRRRKHLGLLNNGKHHSSKLQIDYNEYGKADFSFVVIESDIEEKNALSKETEWIIRLDSHKNGYNVYPTGGSPPSRERAEKLSKAMRKQQGPKPIVSVDIKSKEIRYYKSIAEAAQDLNLKNGTNISSCISGSSSSVSAYGRIWCEQKLFNEQWLQERLQLVDSVWEGRRRYNTPNHQKILQDHVPHPFLADWGNISKCKDSEEFDPYWEVWKNL